MPSYGQTVTLQYVAWNTSSNTGQTGDAGNHTLRWVKDGTEDTTTLPTGMEIDSANCPGIYKATITAGQAQCQVGTLCGKSSTSNVVLLPLTVTFENLPTALPAASGGLPTVGTGSGQINPNSGGVDVQTIKTQPVTCSAGVTVNANVGTSNLLSVDSGGNVSLVATQSGVVQTGTAQAGAPQAITLSSAASSTGSLYVGNLIKIVSGTGAGQTRTITNYTGTTKVAGVDWAWITQPDTTSVYVIFNADTAALNNSLQVAALVQDKTGFSLAASQTFSTSGSVGSVAGPVGSVSGVTFPANFGSSWISSTGQVGLDFTNIKQATANTTLSNITVPMVTSVSNVTGGIAGNVTGSVGSVTSLTTTTIAAAILATPSQLLQTDSSGHALVSLTQVIPATGNTGNSLADCLNAARAQGFGKWILSGTTLTLYGADGATVVRTFTLDSASAPTQRS